jgi:O-antigen ligase
VTPAARVSAALHIGHRPAALLLVGGMTALTLLVVAAVGFRGLPLAVALVAGAVATIVSFRWPIVGLVALAALIPIEEIGTIAGFGTLSRAAGALFAVTYALPRLTSLRLSAMPLAGWAFVGWAMASAVWAHDPEASWRELPTLIQLFVVAVLIADYTAREPRIVRPVLAAYSVSATVTAVIGIATHLGGGFGRSVAIEGQNPAQFAAVLLPAFTFGLNEVLGGTRRFAGGFVALLAAVAIVLSGTRGAWVAMAVVPLVLLPNLSPKRATLGIVAIATLALFTYQLPGIADMLAVRLGNAVSTGGAGRTDIWSAGLVIYAGSPVVGVGYANFPVAYTPEVVRAAHITSAYTLSGYAPHNIVVGTLAELGLVGLITLGLFLVPLAVRRGFGPDAGMVRASMASLLAMALFLDIVGNRKQVWLVIGLAAGLRYLQRNREDSGPETREVPPPPVAAAVLAGPPIRARPGHDVWPT